MSKTGLEKATFGAGCFWGVEDIFMKLKGVIETQVGYAGGDFDHPSYQDVCSGVTNHAEVVEIIYDPEIISYGDLLDIFWDIHNPTTLNRQGPDIGTQYRSIILYHNSQQKKLALEKKKHLNSSSRYGKEIVTEIKPAGKFWRAEEHHQKYVEKNRPGKL